jgi:hypothetical protein
MASASSRSQDPWRNLGTLHPSRTFPSRREGHVATGDKPRACSGQGQPRCSVLSPLPGLPLGLCVPWSECWVHQPPPTMGLSWGTSFQLFLWGLAAVRCLVGFPCGSEEACGKYRAGRGRCAFLGAVRVWSWPQTASHWSWTFCLGVSPPWPPAPSHPPGPRG